MSRTLVASQLPDVFNSAIAEHSLGIDIVPVPTGVPAALPPEASILLAAPFRRAGGDLPKVAPTGWPHQIQWIQLASVGIDVYPDWLFEGPVVTSARGSSDAPLAEFALAAILAEAKRIPDIWIDDAARWQPQPLALVAGQTLGLVGFGSIGGALAPRAQALGLKVVAVRRSDTPIAVPGVERLASVGELFARSDHVVLAAPSTPQTFGLVSRAVLARAKPGLHLINIARGALIDDEALLDALDEGRLSRATLDVTYPEPLPAGHRFYTHPRVRLSAHTSVHTPDTWRKLAAQFAQNLERFRQGAPLLETVDRRRGY